LIDYEEFCGMPAHDHSPYETGAMADVPQIAPVELMKWLKNGRLPLILDVREPHEWDISNLGAWGAVLIPQKQVAARLDELDAARDIVVQCRTGVRSTAIVRDLQKQGFTKLWNLDGGINRWAEDVDPTMQTY
jgi:adenylyltransferase/sulfurtransferase